VHDQLHALYEPLCALFVHACRAPGGGEGGEGGATPDEAEPMRMNRFEWLALCRDAKALRKTFSAAKAEAVFAAAMSTSHGSTAGDLLFS